MHSVGSLSPSEHAALGIFHNIPLWHAPFMIAETSRYLSISDMYVCVTFRELSISLVHFEWPVLA